VHASRRLRDTDGNTGGNDKAENNPARRAPLRACSTHPDRLVLIEFGKDERGTVTHLTLRQGLFNTKAMRQ